MRQRWHLEEDSFLADATDDIIHLACMVSHACLERTATYPTSSEFEQTLAFIQYLNDKYGDHLRCQGFESFPPYLSSLPRIEIVPWLRAQFQAGRYPHGINYGIWFELDAEVIPAKYFAELEERKRLVQEEWEKKNKQ